MRAVAGGGWAVAHTADPLGHADRRRWAILWVGGLAAALVLSVVAAVSLGSVAIAPGTVWRVVGHELLATPAVLEVERSDHNIVWLVRAPRVLLAATVGAGLAVAGVALQAMVRNVLADPYLLGVTSGASFGAALAILFSLGVGLGAGALTASAFAGGLAATVLVFALARIGGRITAIRLVMAGVAVGYLLGAATTFTIFAADTRDGARAVLFWMLGSLGQAGWSQLAAPAAITVAATALLWLWARRLDAIAVGDATAMGLGVDPGRLRAVALVVVALLVGALVAVSGAIGFVGLIVPHVARRLVGGGHRLLLIVAPLVGATFLVWADLVARVAFAPRELPLGVVTAIVGAPFLFMLVRRVASPGAS